MKSKASLSLLVDFNPMVDSPHSKPRDMNVWVRKLLCQCADLAKKQGAKFVAIWGHNKCFMIDESDLGIETKGKKSVDHL